MPHPMGAHSHESPPEANESSLPFPFRPQLGPETTPLSLPRRVSLLWLPARPAVSGGGGGDGAHLALAGLRSSAPHEALVDGPQVLLPVIHFEATQVRTAGRCNDQLRIQGLALRLGPRHHRGQGPTARGGRRRGRGRQCGAGAARRRAPGVRGNGAGTKRGQPRGGGSRQRLCCAGAGAQTAASQRPSARRWQGLREAGVH